VELAAYAHQSMIGVDDDPLLYILENKSKGGGKGAAGNCWLLKTRQDGMLEC
jgi:hypothetical protein